MTQLKGSTGSSIEVAIRSLPRRVPTRDSIEETTEETRRPTGPKLEPTLRVVGNFQPPESVRNNRPDMTLLHEARRLLKYKSNLTLLEWWHRWFPVGKWWRYAIAATEHLSTTKYSKYKFFLKCLLSAAKNDKYYAWASKFLQTMARVDLVKEAQAERAIAPVCAVCNGRVGGCEECDPMIVKVRQMAMYLIKRIHCSFCDGRICMSCVADYVAQIDRGGLKMTVGDPPDLVGAYA